MGDVTFRLQGATVTIHDNDRNDRPSRGDTLDITRYSGPSNARTEATTHYTGAAVYSQLRQLGIRSVPSTRFAALRSISTHLDNAWDAHRGRGANRLQVIERETRLARIEMLHEHVMRGPVNPLNLWRPVNFLTSYAFNALRTQRDTELESQSGTLLRQMASGSVRGQNAFDRVATLERLAASYGMSTNSGVQDARVLLNLIYTAGLKVRDICNSVPNANSDFTAYSAEIQTLLTRRALPTARLEELNAQRDTALQGRCR